MPENETTAIVEDEPIMPDGYGDDYEDIFASDGTDGGVDGEDAPAEAPLDELFGIESEDLLSALAAEGTTPSQDTDSTDTVSGEARDKSTTTARGDASNKLRFKASIDHADQDVELDESELPTIYQKAYATDRAQARLKEADDKIKGYEARMRRLDAVAKNRGFESGEEMLNETIEDIITEMTNGGTPEAIARDYVERTFGALPQAAREPEPEQAVQENTTPKPSGRDYKAEVNELLAMHGELRGQQIPKEVLDAAIGGKRLSVAYEQYLLAQERGKAAKMQKENSIMRQNASAASRAPVRGVRGGVSAAPSDYFSKGFDDDDLF